MTYTVAVCAWIGAAVEFQPSITSESTWFLEQPRFTKPMVVFLLFEYGNLYSVNL